MVSMQILFMKLYYFIDYYKADNSSQLYLHEATTYEIPYSFIQIICNNYNLLPNNP
ncbi:hypothetical protein Syun_003355 [Stephania yunnanensis]|uniref:Uncharacterized protein n=1 Tax=Stephania yunnanensis TaxID=152371 RepID=A0AAP0L2J4_9MAGN